MRAPMLALLLAASVAHAMPIDEDFVEERAPHHKRAFVCPANTSWEKLKRCLEQHDKLIVLHEYPDAKLVRLHGGITTTPTLFLYMRVDNQWLRVSFYGELGPNSELLAIKPFVDHSIRLDMGYAYPSSVMLDDITPTPALLRHKITSLCTSRGVCTSVVTACELDVRGKAYWSYRGKPVWDGSLLRVAADATNAGAQCELHDSMRAPVGDPLL